MDYVQLHPMQRVEVIVVDLKLPQLHQLSVPLQLNQRLLLFQEHQIIVQQLPCLLMELPLHQVQQMD